MAADGTPPPPRHLAQLDGLRGLAALAVVVAHFNPAPADVAPGSVMELLMALWRHFALGNLAVSFFFALSAFLLTYLARHELATTGSFAPGRFFMRRLLRIWPLYFCVVGVAFLVQADPIGLATESAARRASSAWLQEHWPVYLFASNWSLVFNSITGYFDLSPGTLRILWSIAVEEQFYVIYPLMLWLVLRRARAGWAGIALLAAGAWAFRLWFIGRPASPDLQSDGGLYYATLSYVEIFVAGAVAGWTAAAPGWQPGRLIRGRWTGPVLLLGGLGLGLLWSDHLWYPYSWISLTIYPVLGILMAMYLLWSAQPVPHRLTRLCAWRPFRIAGTLSYGIYMWHVLANVAVIAALQQWAPDSFAFSSPWTRLGLSIGAVLLCATLSRFLIERPFLRLKDRFRTAGSPPPAVAPPAPIAPATIVVDEPDSNRRPWRLVLVLYVLLYGALLLHTGGFPYTIDNNESFSSLVHARNLAEFDLTKSYGLTDESYALTEAGHPYIHSHQGNFPRLFAFVLYVFGARSIESQIWLTTFTVGLAAMWLAFRFTQRLGGPWFGALACLVLMTDYVLFAQWQVNTYRVWHAFFFFSSLECVHLPTRGRWTAWALVVVNFAALFYWEYVFGAFVGLMAALYALLVHRPAWRSVSFTWTGIFTGGLLAAGTLLAQLTAYMGWANVLKDIRYTLLARNSAADAAFAAEVNAFYDRHNILFWQNYLDTSALKSWAAAWQGVLAHHWEYTSPTFVALTLVMLAGWALAALPFRPAVRRAAPLHRPGRWLGLLGRFGLFALVVFPLVRAVELLAGWPFPGHTGAYPSVLEAGLCLLLPVALAGLWFREVRGLARLGWLRLMLAGGFFTAVHAALARWPSLASASSGPPTQALIGWLHGSWPGAIAIGLVLGVVLSLLLLGPAQVLGRRPARHLGLILCFVAATTGAFIAVYFVFTGYIFSGYLHRQAPFLVFGTDVLLALALGIVLLAAARLIARRVFRRRPRTLFQHGLRILLPLGAAATVLVLAQGWLSLQAGLWRAVPPTKYRFLAQLKDPPYRGESFAVSTYAAPVAANTGSWAYFESTLFSGTLELGRAGWITPYDHQYLWFGDRLTNPAYRQPAYALTIVQPDSVARSLEAAPDYAARAAETNGLFQRASTPFQSFLTHRVAATDGRNYSIVRLDWNYPPYLQPHDEQIRRFASLLTMDQKLALSTTAREMARRWRVEVDLPAGAPPDRIALTCDNQPVSLSRTAATSALTAVLHGDRLHLRLLSFPGGGQARVTVNDATELIDLPQAAEAERAFTWSSGQPHGKHTYVPAFPPGVQVQTSLKLQDGVPIAELTYRYAHQTGATESGTVVRLYAETTADRWRLADTITFLGSPGVPVRLAEFRRNNPDVLAEYSRIAAAGDIRSFEMWLGDHLAGHPAEWSRPGIVHEALPDEVAATVTADAPSVRRLPLPAGSGGRLQFSVTPGTRHKTGVEYFGLAFPRDVFIEGPVAFAAPAISYSALDLPFGRLRLKLRFPANRWPQSEPVVTTGSNEAGDIVYVIYHDPNHIRLGFDHWFKGGPVTKPIPIDFTREHELEISIGSLYPSSEDIVFFGMPEEAVAAVKNRVQIKLDGQTVIDSEAVCYDSRPDQVTVGRNTINGTSAGPAFTGEILSVERVWPTPQ